MKGETTKVIGVGLYASTYLEQTSSGQLVAIKKFNLDAHLTQEEINYNIRLGYYIKHQDNPPILTLKYLGTDLDQKLTSLLKEDKIEISKKILEELVKIHKQDLIHNDIKPDNIILKEQDDGQWQVSIIDPGKLQPTGQTVSWKAPETTTSDATKTSDIFSVGYVITTYLLNDPSDQDLTNWIKEKAMSKEPENRASIEEILEMINIHYNSQTPFYTRRISTSIDAQCCVIS